VEANGLFARIVGQIVQEIETKPAYCCATRASQRKGA
jgi:hypothetical protein